MTDTKRASNVCHACKLRKKTCDKALPTCTFCKKRRLVCDYHNSAPKSRSERAYNPGKHFVAIHTPNEHLASPQNVAASRDVCFREGRQRRDSFISHHPHPYYPQQSREEGFGQLADDLIEASELSRDDVLDRYFDVFHKWLPVIAPASFRQEVLLCRKDGRLPPADVAALLLAMLLSIRSFVGPSQRLPRASQDLICTTIKSVINQARALGQVTLHHVQAGLLVALHEYACLRSEAACATVRTCSDLAHAIDPKQAPMSGAESQQDAGPDGMERDTLAWAIAMLERLALCEMDANALRLRRPQIAYPASPFTRQGSNLRHDSQYDRQIRSIPFLDRMLHLVRLTADGRENVAEVMAFDAEIRTFLQELISDLEWLETRLCVFVALCVRLLFLLHQSVLKQLRRSDSEVDHERVDISQTALDWLCRMVLDLVETQGQGTGPTMPICCFYNLQAARRCMQERKRKVMDAETCDVEKLLRAEEGYRETWIG